MKYLIISDFRESFANYAPELQQPPYNDHPSKRNIDDIITAIISLGYDCEYFGGIPELIDAVHNNLSFENSIFLNFTDGMYQNYSRVQAPVLLDILNTAYSGSDVFSSVLMNNKHFCKQALLGNNILMPESFIVNKVIPLENYNLSSLEYPLFVKPNCEGSSLGISSKSVCHTIEDTIICVKELQKKFDEIIVEKYIPGIDITNYLIGNGNHYYINDIIMSQLFDKSPFAVYGAKEKHNKLRTLFYNEEKIPVKTLQDIRQQSIKIAKIIGVKDICRIDYRYNPQTEKFYFIEINSAPRFSITSEIGLIAEKRNLTFADMTNYYINAVNNRIL